MSARATVASVAPPLEVAGRSRDELEGRFAWAWPVLCAALAAATLGFAAFRPLAGDDVYILENLRSGAWSRRLFAFDLDAPSADYVAWWSGIALQRRFVRVPASALLWVESELFGLRAAPYHLLLASLAGGPSCRVGDVEPRPRTAAASRRRRSVDRRVDGPVSPNGDRANDADRPA